MTEYIETKVSPGDTRTDILETLSGGLPFAFVYASFSDGGQLDLKMEVGGGVTDVKTVRSLLQKTLDALPAGD